MGEQGDTNVEIKFRKITLNHSTGSENFNFTDEEDSSGVQVSSGSHEDEYTESDEDDDEWDYIDEIDPSDSASRPRVKHHGVPPPAPAPRSQTTRHKPSRHVPVHDPPTRHRSHSRHTLEHERRSRRRRPVSTHSDSLDGHDDYPGYAPRPGQPPHHPSAQWAHIQQGAPSGYAPSMMSDPRYNPFQGGPQPGSNSLVPFGSPDQYGYNQNPFAPGPGPGNPFASPQGGGGPNGYFDGHAQGGRRNHRNSMPPMPSGEMMPFYGNGGYYPQYPPMGPYGMPNMPPMYPPYPGAPHTTTPPAHHPPSKKSTPGPPMEHAHMPPPPPPPPPPMSTAPQAPLPPPSMPMGGMPPPMPEPPKDDGVLSKLEKLLLGKQEIEEKAAEDAKFSRLEKLLIDQQTARAEKEAAKKKAADEAAIKAAEAKKRGDEDKLAKLEKLILAQKDEQLKREEALEAARKAEKAEADAKVAKEAEEKKAAAEAAAKLLEAAKKAREEAEAKAAKEAEETKAAHEKATEELEKAKKAAEEEAAKHKPNDAPKAPIKFKDAVGRKFSFPWHLCKTWKGMEELIKQAFLHVDVIGPHVHEGHYDLVGPDGEIILPQVWETMVQPDWSITMHMWPMPEPPPPPPDIPKEAMMGPPEFMGPPLGKSKSKSGKGKKRESRVMPDPHMVIPPPPPIVPGAPPPPPPGIVIPPDAPPPPGVINMTPGVGPTHTSRPRQKVAASPFMRWAAGGSSGRSQSLKDLKKPEGSRSPTAAATPNGEACIVM